MRVLEKILEEIDAEAQKQKEISKEIYGTHGWNVYAMAISIAKDIIRRHLDDDGWIPVEERLPEPGIYLVSCDDKDYPVKRMRMKGICFYDHEGIYDGKVYAWQPLPKPYQPKEGRNE